MPFTGTYLLAAIDGTDSRKWGEPLPNRTNSHTHKFYQQFKVGNRADKIYVDGPVGFAGIGTESIANSVSNKLRRRIKKLYPRSTPGHDQLRVVLVGHSRGGLVAINVAARLQVKVWFLGLFDSVDRHFGLSGDKITNVKACYHAVRNENFQSRSYFGNTWRPKELHWYKEKEFSTSHGGLGGAPDLDPDKSFFSFADQSCDNETLKGGIYSLQGINLEQLCMKESVAAYQWMRQRAIEKGIPLR